MNANDLAEFKTLITGVMAYHGKPMSEPLLQVWWNGCKQWTLPQVRRALNALTVHPEHGKFPPKIGDMTAILEGSHTDRAAVAWGKTLEAMSSVGAYTDVVFDDPVIHVVVEDMGGWPKLCRTELKELGMVQTRFTKAYTAYAGRLDGFQYPPRLGGAGSSAQEWERIGLPAPKPKLIGNPQECLKVMRGGTEGGRLQITSLGSISTGAFKRLGDGS